MKNLDRASIEEISDSVRILYEAKQEYEKAKSYYESVKKRETTKISNFMFANCEKDENNFYVNLKEGVRYYNDPKKIKVLKVKPKKIHWNLEKLKKKLKKSVYDCITERTYIITDYRKLVQYLDYCGVNPKIFKLYVDTDDKINMKEFEKAYGTGDIKMSDVSGCYQVEEGEPYIRLTEYDTQI